MKRVRRTDQTPSTEGSGNRDSDDDHDPETLSGRGNRRKKSVRPGEKDKFGNDRFTHNLAEKRRSERIRKQVQNLEEMLKQAGRESKRDRSSILASTASYIKELEQSIASMRESSNLAMTTPATPFATSMSRYGKVDAALDYHSLFVAEGLPKAVASLSGKFLDCNAMFTWLTGYSRDKLTSLSFFDLTPERELNKTQAMVGELLSLCQGECSYNGCCSKSFRKECIFNDRLEEVYIILSLVCKEQGSPQHFACTVLPLVYADARAQSVFCVDVDGKAERTKSLPTTGSNCCSLSFTHPPQVPVGTQSTQGNSSSLQIHGGQAPSIAIPEHVPDESFDTYSDMNELNFPATGMDHSGSEFFGTPWSQPTSEDNPFPSSTYFG
eukprot:gb/GECG01013491.1/.p1 GENE.gb/GECG01013491.1/~~gb/GECG01013491.1/.p1  ORF type:complete len:382 (+),score=45.84 gb/GECG01013491.1/:1-1146(+)